MMNRSSSTKNDAVSIAAMPQIVFRIPAIRTMIPAKSSQPSPLTARRSCGSFRSEPSAGIVRARKPAAQ